MFNKKEKNKNRVLVRVCIGCILPHTAKLIGEGEYQYMDSTKGRINEHYYDYEILEDDLEIFLEINSKLLIKYQLLDVEKEPEKEDKNPVKPTTMNGWIKKQ
mgnify:CR=1 FL=1